jgi:hypothetical protein
MIREVSIQCSPFEAQSEDKIRTIICNVLELKSEVSVTFQILKRSLDARSRVPFYLLKCKVYIDESSHTESFIPEYRDVTQSDKKVLIVGAGPAGLFAALKLIELGIKPIIIDRGKNIQERRRDLAFLNREGRLNEESNYCFGEGGAGTYSDGKLYTRSNKRGNIQKVLNIFHYFGADANILIDAHPHIGTNKLPNIIANMRKQILDCGGEVHFDTKLMRLKIDNNKITGVGTSKGDIVASSVILATGHSASDIYFLLDELKILIESKPLAIGVRIEHPQHFIDQLQYKCLDRGPYLPPASYSLVEQAEGRGVFSFCMCPGGVIATSSTQHEHLVVNGWSPSKRNNPFANSGMVVSLLESDYGNKFGALSALRYQMNIEHKAYLIGGGDYCAPAQRVTDFMNKKVSNSLPHSSYLRPLTSSDMQSVLPSIITHALRKGLSQYDKKFKGYIQNEAIIVGVESRTSSPVRIPRDQLTLMHPQVYGLFPCGEGAGYAGGIVSAAMDGERVAQAIDCLT